MAKKKKESKKEAVFAFAPVVGAVTKTREPEKKEELKDD